MSKVADNLAPNRPVPPADDGAAPAAPGRAPGRDGQAAAIPLNPATAQHLRELWLQWAAAREAAQAALACVERYAQALDREVTAIKRWHGYPEDLPVQLDFAAQRLVPTKSATTGSPAEDGAAPRRAGEGG